MKFKNLHEKSISELNDYLLVSLREKFYLRMQSMRSGHAQKSHLMKEARRKIARIKTILTEKVTGND